MLSFNYVIDSTKIRGGETMEKWKWNAILNIVEEKISKPSFQTWFSSTSAEIINEDTIIITSPNSFSAEWLRTHYSDLIFQAIKEVTGQNFNVEIQSSQKEEPFTPPTLTVNAGLKTDNNQELIELVNQQSSLILKQQVKIDELEKRLASLELKTQ